MPGPNRLPPFESPSAADVLSAVPVPVFVLNQEGRFQFANEACLALLGYTREEFCELFLWDVDAHFSRVFWAQGWASLREAPRAATSRYRMRDGREIDVEVNGVRRSLGGIESVIVVVRPGPDGSQQKLDLQEWSDRAALAELEQVYRLAPVGLFVLNREYRFVRLNERMAQINGKPMDEQIGRTIFEVTPGIAPGLVETYAPVLERGEPVLDLEVRGETPEDPGGVRDWLCSYYPLRTTDGEIAGLVGAVLDVTWRREAEAQRRLIETRLDQAQRLESLGVLAGGIAHDFNNLLVAVMGNASLALAELDASHAAHECVRRIESASQRATELVKQMLAYSGRGRSQVESVDVSALLAELAELLKAAVTKRAPIRLALTKGLPAVEADATQLRQVAMNLITNASDAMGDGDGSITLATGEIEVDAHYLSGCLGGEGLAEGRYVFLEVSDTGCGMDEATVRRIFDPFFSTKTTGRGLGLSAVLGIVKAHKGAIRVYSEVGHGTSMKVLLPAMKAAVQAPRPSSSKPRDAVGAGRCVLVVDDDEHVRLTARRMLERAGFLVAEACDGLEALNEVRCHPEVAAVILDLTMPRMGGAETLTELRRFRPHLPVVLSSGYNAEDATSRFGGEGRTGFVQKPYSAKDLVAAVASALE